MRSIRVRPKNWQTARRQRQDPPDGGAEPRPRFEPVDGELDEQRHRDAGADARKHKPEAGRVVPAITPQVRAQETKSLEHPSMLAGSRQ